MSAAAPAQAPAPVFTVEIECKGIPYIWTGEAKTAYLATLYAFNEQEFNVAGFSRAAARVTTCVQVQS